MLAINDIGEGGFWAVFQQLRVALAWLANMSQHDQTMSIKEHQIMFRPSVRLTVAKALCQTRRPCMQRRRLLKSPTSRLVLKRRKATSFSFALFATSRNTASATTPSLTFSWTAPSSNGSCSQSLLEPKL